MADEFGFIPAERDGVVAVSDPGGPGEGLGCEYRRHLRRVRKVAQRQSFRPTSLDHAQKLDGALYHRESCRDDGDESE